MKVRLNETWPWNSGWKRTEYGELRPTTITKVNCKICGRFLSDDSLYSGRSCMKHDGKNGCYGWHVIVASCYTCNVNTIAMRNNAYYGLEHVTSICPTCGGEGRNQGICEHRSSDYS